MKKLISLALALFMLFSYGITNALDAPKNLKLESSTTNSLEISWDSVETAGGYYVYYGKESLGKNGDHSILDEIALDNKATILDLDAETTYYISVVAADESLKEKSSFSEKAVFTTKSLQKQDNSFALEEVNVLSSNKIELVFNKPLNNSQGEDREFKIVNKNDNLDELDVIENKLLKEENKLELTLDRDMISSGKYNITVISVVDNEGNNIKSGVDGLNSFPTPDIFPKEISDEEIIESELEGIELESAKDSDSKEPKEPSETSTEEGESLGGKDVSKEELNKNTQIAAKNINKLPKTGPEHWVLLILALILGTIYLKVNFKKS